MTTAPIARDLPAENPDVTYCQATGCDGNIDTDSAGFHSSDEDSWKVIAGRALCPDDWFRCEAHEENVPATERADCDHLRICKGCADERYCLDCERADHFWDSVDRQYDMSKGGDLDD